MQEQLLFDQWIKIVETVAIVVGGFWALWRYNALKEAQTADLNNRLNLTELLSRQPNISMSIKVEETPWKEDSVLSFLSVLVTMKNEGNQNAYVGFPKGALTVGRIMLDKSGETSVRKAHRFPTCVFREDSNKLEPLILEDSLPENDTDESAQNVRIFRAGQERQLAFAVPITELGGYFIQFSCIYKRRPFDGEQQDEESAGREIHSMQQTIFFATGTAPNATTN